MAFDPNSIPSNLHPINIARTLAEESRISPVTLAVSNSNPSRDNSPGGSIPVYFPPESGYVGLGYGPAITNWLPRMPAPVGVNSTTGYGYNPNVGLRVDPNFAGHSVAGGASDRASDEGGDDSVSGKKVKFLCSFGGKILPRPSDGALRYVGGNTRIISVRRDVGFNELVQKMLDSYGQNVVIKYQLPDEDLDALVSVSGPDDLENMMDEYDKLVERSSDGSAKLRVFLFLASELESSSLVRFGDFQDSGQRYVEAVNGVGDGVGGSGVIARKESMASATSTQNSELSGTDQAVDSTGHYQGDASGSGPPFTGRLSPRGNIAASQETARRLNSGEPTPTVQVEASVGKSVPVPSLSAQSEHELERFVPVPGQQLQLNYDLQHPGVTYPPRGPYVQAYVDPRHGTLNRTEYVQVPSQMGFPTQILGTVGPMFSQQQFHDNAVGVSTPHQFIPSVHMTMTPSSHVSFHPNATPQIVQQQQEVRLEHYPEESTYGQRVVQVSGDPNYNAYQAQVPSAVVGGPYGWNQAPHPEQVAFSESRVLRQQVINPETLPRFEGCFMCQKALPHAHSDTLAHEGKESPIATVADMNSVYHSLRLEDNRRAMQPNRVPATGAFGEGIVENKGVGVPPRVVCNKDQEAGKPYFEGAGTSPTAQGQYTDDRIIVQGAGISPTAQGQYVVSPTSQGQYVVSPTTQGQYVVSPTAQGQYVNDRSIAQKAENPDHTKVLVPQGVVGFAGGIQSPYGVLLNNVPHTGHESVAQQFLPTHYQVKQDTSVNKPINSDFTPVGGPSPTSDQQLLDSPRDYSVKVPDTVESCYTYDNLRQIDGRMEDLRIRTQDVFLNNEQSNLPVDNPQKEDILESRQLQIAGRELNLDNSYSKPLMVLDANHLKQNEMVPSSSEVIHLHGFQPLESYEAQQPLFSNPDYTHATVAMNNLASSEVSCFNPACSGVDPVLMTEGISPVSERRDYPSQLDPRMVPGDVESVTVDSLSPFNGVGETQDTSNSLFSNQDPWNLRYDIHFPPPRPNKILTKKETFGTKDAFGDNRLGNNGESPPSNVGGLTTEMQFDEGVYQASANFDRNFSLEHGHSNKGSAEEQIKQELQAVAASVLQPSVPSNPDLTGNGRSEYSIEAKQYGKVQHNNAEVQHGDKLEDVKTKLPEKPNLGFPVSDGLGRLQIINNTDLEELRELGSGTFGTVYHGKWRGSDVAIKRINDRCFAGKASEQERMREDFWNEAIKLADLHHPNVVAFYGVVLDGPGGSVATATEYMVNGSLRNALQKNERNLDKRKRLLIAMDVAFGMEYLHGKNIVHFDLKSDNLLVNLRDPHCPICKVGDLGLSKVKCQTLISGGVRGTLPWMAPELLNGSSSLVSEKVDVFSFGIVMWELLTGDEPYADLHYGAIIGGIVSNTLRPPVPEYCDPEWRSLMERCWSAEPSERPSFTEIANQLRTIAAKVPPKVQLQQ